MRWLRWLRRPRHAETARRESEAAADRAEHQVKRPLREMRDRDHLADELIRQLRQGGHA